jgi:hypothetical protein
MRAQLRGVICRAVFAALILIRAVAPAGAEPAVEGYADFDAMRVQLETVAKSRFATLQSLAVTHGGRDVFLLTLGTDKTAEKPAVLVIGGVHPPQLAGSELAVRLARRLVEGAERDEATRKLLGRVTFYVIPRASPDAAETFFRRPYVERVRNDRPVDDDRDGDVDEDGPNDLDGDGWITMMRVADPAGEYVEHPDDERVMVKADPKRGEEGRWSLYVEGTDDDGDEQFNEDPPGGVAFNRNFTFEYPFFKEAAGPHQVSEPETRAVADFAFAHPNVAAVFCFTPEDNLMRPWKADGSAASKRIKTSLLPEDEPYTKHLAERYQEIHGGSDPPESPDGKGSVTKWAYFHYGRWSWAARGWWIPKVQPETGSEKKESEAAGGAENAAGEVAEKPGTAKSDDDKEQPAKDDRGADERNALRWFAREGIDGFVPWKRVEHPDFPDRRVEVGGFKPFVRLNPPAGDLDSLAEKHVEFLVEAVGKLPRLQIEPIEAEPLGGGVWRVKVTVVNRGFLPTVPEMGRVSEQPHPLQMAIELPEGASLVTGHARVRVAPLSGGGGKTGQSWLVRVPAKRGPGGLRVRAWSPSVGSAKRELRLPKADTPEEPTRAPDINEKEKK